MRLVTGSEPCATTAHLFTNVMILSIYQVNTFQIRVFIHKILLMEVEIFNQFNAYFMANSSIHFNNTRQSMNLIRPTTVTLLLGSIFIFI